MIAPIIADSMCSGCGACKSKCPTHSIAMHRNAEGFLEPVVDESTCIHCGLCYKTCPSHDLTNENMAEPEAVAAIADNALRMASSSGGVFSLLAQAVLDNGGIVCGAAYDDQFFVHHIIIDDPADLPLLQKSKYMQSDLGNCMEVVRTELKAGREVLFTGSPCQVAGLKKFLGKDYENLTTVAVLCHGVPSPTILHRFLQEQHNAPLQSLDFRAKETFGWRSGIVARYSDGFVYKSKGRDCPWFIGFIQNFFVNKVCGHCPYNTLPRIEDITLGDFWQIRKWNKAYADDRGTSLVLLNNDKANRLFQRITLSLQQFESVPLEFALKSNPNISHSFTPSPLRETFFNALSSQSVTTTLQSLIPKKKSPWQRLIVSLRKRFTPSH